MVTSLIRPSWPLGFARKKSECEPSARNLWDGKVGHWVPSLGVTGINTLYDVSGYKNHGAMSGLAISDWVINRNGYILDFNGTSGGVDCGSNNILDAQNTFTYAAWIKNDSVTGNHSIIDKQNASSRWRWAFRLSDANLYLYIDYSTTDLEVRSSTTLATGTLYHVACTHDKSEKIGRFYINGVESGYTTQTTGAGTIYDNSGGVLAIGFSSGVGDFFDGFLGDIRMYNRVLTPNEIIQLYRDPFADLRLDRNIYGRVPAVAGGRIMSSLVNAGGLAGYGGIAGRGGGLAG